MTAGYYESHERRLKFLMFKIVCSYVSMHVINAYKRYVTGVSHGLCGGNPYQKCPHQTRAVCDTYQVDFFCAYAGIIERLAYYIVDALKMLSGGYLRHDSAVSSVYVNLGAYYIAHDKAAVGYHRGCSLITACLYSKCKESPVFHCF